MSATVTILAGHPYFDCVKPSVWKQSWNGKWTVRWRDFYTVKQDAEFDTEAEARAFARRIVTPPITVKDRACDLAECHSFWREMKESK